MKKKPINTVEDLKNKQTVNQNKKINDSVRRVADADEDFELKDDYDVNVDSPELFKTVEIAFTCDNENEAKKIIAVARMKGDDYLTMLDYSFDNNDEVTVGEDRYRVFDEGELEDYAVQSMEDLLEYDTGISGLAEWAQEEAIERFCSYNYEDDMHESNLSYAGDIASEEGAEGYANRLIEEAVERGIISDDDLDENGDYNGGDYDELIDDFADNMDSDYSTMSEWFESIYGRGWANEVSDALKNQIDWHGIAEWVIQMDGARDHANVEATEDVDGETFYIIEW